MWCCDSYPLLVLGFVVRLLQHSQLAPSPWMEPCWLVGSVPIGCGNFTAGPRACQGMLGLHSYSICCGSPPQPAATNLLNLNSCNSSGHISGYDCVPFIWLKTKILILQGSVHCCPVRQNRCEAKLHCRQSQGLFLDAWDPYHKIAKDSNLCKAPTLRLAMGSRPCTSPTWDQHLNWSTSSQSCVYLRSFPQSWKRHRK